MLEIRRRSDAHEILEGELFAGFISVNRGLGNKGRPGEGSGNAELRGSA